jgi:hypothetical protein
MRLVVAVLSVAALGGGCLLDRGGLLLDEGVGGAIITTSQGGATTAPTTGGMGPSTGGGGSGGAPPDCALTQGFECVPIPDSIAGAFEYLGMVDDVSACPADVKTLQGCSCACGAASAPCAATANIYSNSTCNTGFTGPLPTGTCSPGPPGNSNRYARLAAAPVGSCEAQDPSPNPETASGCRLEPDPSRPCPDGATCVPAVTNARSCIAIDIGSMCPPEYPEAGGRWAESITACTCSCETSCSQAALRSHLGGDDCDDNPQPPLIAVDAVGCAVLGQPNSIEFPPFAGTCSPTTAAVGATGAKSLCCRP